MRFRRPYFLLTLLGSSGRWRPPALLPRRRGARFISQAEQEQDLSAASEARLQAWAGEHPVTDIFVLCHGWHRNLFSAVSAYDRLLSRYALLRHSGRLPLGDAEASASPCDSKPGTSAPSSPGGEPFEPLFIGLHWHSDPGEDGWVDAAGRRSKASFLSNVQVLFRSKVPAASLPLASPAVSPEAALARDFEALFEVMSQLSAPGTDAISDHRLTGCIPGLTQRLEAYELKVAPDASSAEKISAVWRCYFEAEPQGVFLDQGEAPRHYLPPLKALANLVKFSGSLLGLGFLLGPFLNFVQKTVPPWQWFWDVGAGLLASPAAFPERNLREAWAWIAAPMTRQAAQLYSVAALLSLLACLVLLYGAALYKRQNDRGLQGQRAKQRAASSQQGQVAPAGSSPVSAEDPCRRADEDHRSANRANSRGVFQPMDACPSWLLLGPWLAAQAVCTLPLAAYALFSSTLGGQMASLFAIVRRLLRMHDASDERLGQRNVLPVVAGEGACEGASIFSRLRRGRLKYLLAGLARLPLSLAQQAASEDGMVARMADRLDSYLAFFDMQARAIEAGIQAAAKIAGLVGSNPGLQHARLHFIGHSFGGLLVCNTVRHLALDESFEGCLASLCLLEGALACDWLEGEAKVQERVPVIASIYSRYDTATGFYYPVANVGRYAAGYVGLLEGPGFCPRRRGFYASLVRPPDLGLGDVLEKQGRVAVNVDASRLINGGTVASGGGHSLVYRDDVLHLIWAIVRLSWNTSSEVIGNEARCQGDKP